ncbi:MAG: hypothetical protein Q7T54_03470 [Candidatus Levybacteria bacterium]|nr:hypothetical protein [Candidatus Levybacteria bacterium]
MPEEGNVENHTQVIVESREGANAENNVQVVTESREDRRTLNKKMAVWRKLMRDEEDRNRELVLTKSSEEAA